MISVAADIISKVSRDLAWQRFRLSAIALKRTLDFKDPFDFPSAVRSGSILLVGEGNLSFSVSLSGLVGSKAANMTATTFQNEKEYLEITSRNARTLRRRGVKTVAGVDATNLSRWFDKKKFSLIIFQFPNVGSREPRYGRNPNHVLVRRFLRSAAERLVVGGQVAITVINSSHYDGAFDMDGASERNSYAPPIARPFYTADYPGYSHVKTKEDGVSALDEGDEFVTYVFQRKEEAHRK
ncbi:class I SAM-dependent methyltransferase [Neorhizobium alkalisoli]|uniref:Uncharacterized protein DUF2431 n=1 Tax=Neorhizobium alkalisoli TaxID=528178 RepID=A0A561QSD7_9HYPH|nr:class I SAM-dependent methyltransferase [Neorhizobium alkalisoli]TWF53318.1 uncharacterized protein DUF2431 [Neorhizobium alkalisoli]